MVTPPGVVALQQPVAQWPKDHFHRPTTNQSLKRTSAGPTNAHVLTSNPMRHTYPQSTQSKQTHARSSFRPAQHLDTDLPLSLVSCCQQPITGRWQQHQQHQRRQQEQQQQQQTSLSPCAASCRQHPLAPLAQGTPSCACAHHQDCWLPPQLLLLALLLLALLLCWPAVTAVAAAATPLPAAMRQMLNLPPCWPRMQPADKSMA